MRIPFPLPQALFTTPQTLEEDDSLSRPAFNVPKIVGAFGMGYYLQNKLSDDIGTDVPLVSLRALNLYGQNRLFVSALT